MMRKFFKRGIGLITMALMVAFVFLVAPLAAMAANSPQIIQDNQVIVSPMMRAGAITDQVIASARLAMYGPSVAITDQAIMTQVRGIETATIAYATVSLAGTVYEDAINRANTAIERPSMSVVLSNLPEQRNFPLKTC